MNGPTLLDEYLDAALPVEPPPGPQPAAEEIARLIQSLRPAIETILRRFAIPPAEAWIVLQPMVAYAGLHWGETLDPAPWLLETLQRCCREHRACASPPPGGEPAPDDEGIGSKPEAAAAAHLAAA
jgi:hypothetical protein